MSASSPYAASRYNSSSSSSSLFSMLIAVFKRKYRNSSASRAFSDIGEKRKSKVSLLLCRHIALIFVISLFCGVTLFISDFPFFASVSEHQFGYTQVSSNLTKDAWNRTTTTLLSSMGGTHSTTPARNYDDNLRRLRGHKVDREEETPNNNTDTWNLSTSNGSEKLLSSSMSSWLWNYNDIRLSADVQVRSNIIDMNLHFKSKNINIFDNCEGDTSELKTRNCPTGNRKSVDRSERRKNGAATNEGDHMSFFKSLSLLPQCRVLGRPFMDNLARYLSEHYKESIYLAALAKKESVGIKSPLPSQGSSPMIIRPRLTYSCESHRRGRFCGGMGDRFRGMITVFYLALLSNRRFELYHPVPVPLQQFLRPRLLAWVPTVPMVYSGRQRDTPYSATGPTSSDEEGGELGGLQPKLELMRLKQHRKFLRRLSATTVVTDPSNAASVPPLSQGNLHDMRVQSNSQAIDDYISIAAGTGNLWVNKVNLFTQSRRFKSKCNSSFMSSQGNTTKNDEIKKILEQMVKDVNISTYFGCLYEVLFIPSDEVLRGVQEVLSSDDSNAQSPPFAPLGKYVNVHLPHGNSQGHTDTEDTISQHAPSQFMTLYSAAEIQPLSPSPSASDNNDYYNNNNTISIIRRMRRYKLIITRPFIGVQIRIGGHWAEGMHVKEPFRTPPEAVKNFIAMIADVQRMAAKIEIMYKEGSSSSSLSSSVQFASSLPSLQPLCVWPIFVSSDSKRLVHEITKAFSHQNGERRGRHTPKGNVNNKQFESAVDSEEMLCNISVISVRGDEQYDHTDTLNLGEFMSTKYKKINQTRKQTAYFLTLLNHYILGIAGYTVMGQSGFGDTSFWRSRRVASCLFMDMRTLIIGWQHTLSYRYPSLPLITSNNNHNNSINSIRVNNLEGSLSHQVMSRSVQAVAGIQSALMAMGGSDYNAAHRSKQYYIDSISTTRREGQCYGYQHSYMDNNDNNNSSSGNSNESDEFDPLHISPAVALWSSIVNVQKEK
eukprot:Tbor_TRINITY_DN5938_c0_g1::TRINITY_DN5938_c0_g1_i1::g.18807::m.18807